jgi:hypothetical protein
MQRYYLKAFIRMKNFASFLCKERMKPIMRHNDHLSGGGGYKSPENTNDIIQCEGICLPKASFLSQPKTGKSQGD